MKTTSSPFSSSFAAALPAVYLLVFVLAVVPGSAFKESSINNDNAEMTNWKWKNAFLEFARRKHALSGRRADWKLKNGNVRREKWNISSTEIIQRNGSHGKHDKGQSEQQRNLRFLEFGDYIDPTFSCPAAITCPVICVADIDNCPDDAVCPDDGNEYDICVDGTCADITNGETCNDGNDKAKNPCQCDALPVACAKQIDLYDNCFERFQEYYDENVSCLEEQKSMLPVVNFKGPWFLLGYCWMGTVTLLMFGWCAWNQRFSSVNGSVTTLERATSSEERAMKLRMGAKRRADSVEADAKSEEASPLNEATATPYYNASSNLIMEEIWTQTGYKSTFVGSTIYSLVIITHILIQFLLLFFTIEYYKQQEAIVNFGEPLFYDDVQVLIAFELVWVIGFAWCFLLKYPASIKFLFLRRCLHSDAGYIAVSAPVQSVDTHYENKRIVLCLITIGNTFRSMLSCIYSDEAQHPSSNSGYKSTFCKVSIDPKTGSKYFYFRMRRYIYCDETKKYIPGCWDVTQDSKIGSWLDETYLHYGLSNVEACKRLGVVGSNVLDLKKPTIFGSIKNEFSKPFYLYQNAMVWMWMPLWYYYMGIVNTVVRVTGGLVVALFQYGSELDLYRLMVMEGTVEVVREGRIITMDQTDVVPGDIIRLTPGVAYFDMCILQSKHILIDESALTGEVHPIAKIPLDPANSHKTYNPKTNKSSTISAGTTILECGGGGDIEQGDLAIVTQTGSFTAKGELLCDVLSYERHKFKFDTEVQLILAILCVEAVIMLVIVFRVIEDHWAYSWFYAMFVVGTVLPPLLPTVFVVSVGISCKRLQTKRVTCTDSRGILVAGKVDKAFFDKTGTLTKQGLDFVSALKGEELNNLASSKFGRADSVYTSTDATDEDLQRGLAVCHTLNKGAEGKLIGAAVDRMGFSSVQSAQLLNDNLVSFRGEIIQYLKKFEFDHHSMTQSVIVRHGSQTIVYVKGSPDAVSKRCIAKSLPPNFEAKARQSARDGIYQLAMASSKFSSNKPISDVTREDIEKDLTFSGFINYQNTMKDDTPAVVRELHDGGISCSMITGDNVLTGIYIAKKAGLIDSYKPVIIANRICDHSIEWINASDDKSANPPDISSLRDFSRATSLSMTGEVWNYLLKCDPIAALEYAKYTQVFGRTTPDDKVSIVSTFVEVGNITLMCGDGGNDCGALKAAHIGIALSDAEASVVAPFTSLDKSIASVTDVLKEGRCALASALAAYKYMIMYGQVESINQVTNAYLHITFSEWCWVFMDGIWTISMAFSLPLAHAAKKLSANRPTASLLGPHTMISACGVLVINFFFLMTALLLLWEQDWFQCRKWENKEVGDTLSIGDNYETSVIFIISGYQYMSSAAAFNFGYSFRAYWWRNYIFVLFFILWTVLHFISTLTASKFSCIWRLNCDNDHVVRWVTSSEPEPINNVYNTTVMPMSFRVVLVLLMVSNLTSNCVWDYVIVNKTLPKYRSYIDTIEGSQDPSNAKPFLSSGKHLD